MYHTHPTYRGLLAGAAERPADDTPRLVLADWLEEYAGTGAVSARAHADLIRGQLDGRLPAYVLTQPSEPRPHWPPGVLSLLTPLPWLSACHAVRVARGCVEGVRLYPWRFTRDLVRRVCDGQPVQRVRLAPRAPAEVGAAATRDAGYRWAEGPGGDDGEVRGFHELAGDRAEREALRAAAARGENVLQPLYADEEDLIPGPLFRALEAEHARVEYPTDEAAVRALDRAADRVAHRWAGRRRVRPAPATETAYYYLGRRGWVSGPWDAEPDAYRGSDPATGYAAATVRSSVGGWNGYVGVPTDHPLAGADFSVAAEYLTTAYEEPSYAADRLPVIGRETGRNEPAWWFGFSTITGFAVQPALDEPLPRLRDTHSPFHYGTLADCRAAVADLAAQLADVAAYAALGRPLAECLQRAAEARQARLEALTDSHTPT